MRRGDSKMETKIEIEDSRKEKKAGPGYSKTVVTLGRDMLGTETKVEIEDSKTGIGFEDWKLDLEKDRNDS